MKRLLGTRDLIRTVELACRMGNPQNVRLCFDFSRCSKREAFEVEKLFATKSVTDAQFYLGQCFDYGWGGQRKNRKTAIYWYQRAVKSGQHPKAAYNLAQILEEERPSDKKKIRNLLELAARAGHSDSIVSLGYYYFQEYKRNRKDEVRKQFLSLYERGAKLRNPAALYNLYLCYKNGEGVLPDAAKARAYLNAAAVEGSAKAKVLLKRF